MPAPSDNSTPPAALAQRVLADALDRGMPPNSSAFVRALAARVGELEAAIRAALIVLDNTAGGGE
ncbi:hypothetical protein [Streptomyces sp. C1-2]|uniref:hypothetical protein n=1 Tax=Streptomyces sp. C1-2 TaxID=2720022 RepID=UPI00143271CB|nr:hypothetical protein [Streptomyces sp. C1-2]NJP73537.1 hypothetical protein [Streptomyces sp. C1-2]